MDCTATWPKNRATAQDSDDRRGLDRPRIESEGFLKWSLADGVRPGPLWALSPLGDSTVLSVVGRTRLDPLGPREAAAIVQPTRCEPRIEDTCDPRPRPGANSALRRLPISGSEPGIDKHYMTILNPLLDRPLPSRRAPSQSVRAGGLFGNGCFGRDLLEPSIPRHSDRRGLVPRVVSSDGARADQVERDN